MVSPSMRSTVWTKPASPLVRLTCIANVPLLVTLDPILGGTDFWGLANAVKQKTFGSSTGLESASAQPARQRTTMQTPSERAMVASFGVAAAISEKDFVKTVQRLLFL